MGNTGFAVGGGNLTNAQTDRKIGVCISNQVAHCATAAKCNKKNVKTEVQVVNYRKYESKTASASNFKN